MNSIVKYTQYLQKLEQENPITRGASMDSCHAMLILSYVIAAKPKRILEIGIGPGLVSTALIHAVKFNGVGDITCVDNFHDLGGNLPQSMLDTLRANGVRIIAPVNEKEFVAAALTNSFDFLVSDGDHNHTGEWAERVFDMMEPNAIMFFHDVMDYPNIQRYINLAAETNRPYMVFKESTRQNEKCERGTLMIVNKK